MFLLVRITTHFSKFYAKLVNISDIRLIMMLKSYYLLILINDFVVLIDFLSIKSLFFVFCCVRKQ